MRSYDQTQADTAQMIVEFRNTGGTVLATYSTGRAANVSSWVQYNHTRTAPVGTRTIRIRLIGESYNGDSVDSYFDNLSLTGLSTLPVTLLSFTANAIAGESELKWETANEINNKGFYIERSLNGISWETIGFVAAATDSRSSYQYRFTDRIPETGTNYYRLKQVDIDGQFEYSPVKNLQYKYSGATLLFPNPASDVLSLKTRTGKFKAQIINANGKTIALFQDQRNVRIHSLPAGIYYLKVWYDDNTVENLKFIKQ
ncbi:MAG: T9SS type A sorting domain-containing protein [Chitinophagaceae bacterium]|nr:T9SS type A sorting domain-containing protein [Chitinophagaceae bacterium]